MSNVTRIHNYLDHLTVDEVLKYVAQGFELVINDGHIQALILKREEEQHDGRTE